MIHNYPGFYFFVYLILNCIILITGDYIPKWSCDFENGLCHWLQVHDDHYDWSHVSGTRDLLDHTTNSINGKYWGGVCLNFN